MKELGFDSLNYLAVRIIMSMDIGWEMLRLTIVEFAMNTRDAKRTVAVLGASPKSDRYSHKAMMRLSEADYSVIPVNPAYTEIEGLAVVGTVLQAAQVAGSLHTLTLYLAPSRLESVIDDIVAARPQRVIFNPGTELLSLQRALDRVNIPWLEACTLVLLSTGQF